MKDENSLEKKKKRLQEDKAKWAELDNALAKQHLLPSLPLHL